jgi:hypothetical protein
MISILYNKYVVKFVFFRDGGTKVCSVGETENSSNHSRRKKTGSMATVWWWEIDFS